MLIFVCNWSCSLTLDWSAEAACQTEAGFLVNQTIITHFYYNYIIITCCSLG